MKFKLGVEMNDMSVAIWYARAVVERVTRNVCGRGAIITSGRDGKHSANSLHYSGNALDLRTRDLRDDQKQRYRKVLADELGPDFDVVLEKSHIHLEYDPD